MAESAAISIDGKCWMGEPMQAILDGNLEEFYSITHCCWIESNGNCEIFIKDES